MSTSLSPLLAPMLSSAAMRAVCDDVTTLQHMLDFEAALARAEASIGIVPAASAEAIAKACDAGSFDLADLAEAATRSGNLAIPLVKALTTEVARTDKEAARYVHWGATSQDVIDTAAMLTVRAGIDALLSDIDRAVSGFARLARQHRNTAVVARSLLNMPRRCTARAAACDISNATRSRFSSEAPPARSQHSAIRAGKSPKNFPKSFNSPCRNRPGIPTATGLQKQRQCSPSSQAPAARLAATSS
jgi:Lyase